MKNRCILHGHVFVMDSTLNKGYNVRIFEIIIICLVVDVFDLVHDVGAIFHLP